MMPSPPSANVSSRRCIVDQTKQLIAAAAAHVAPCPYCIRGHTKTALRHGATAEKITEATWVAAEMRAGGAYAHSAAAVHPSAIPIHTVDIHRCSNDDADVDF
jgi:AhpD family alkylhydroperoxidase